jgi:hypothetical protein
MTGTHPQNRRLGYARVSTYGQTLDAQLEHLRSAGWYQDLPREGDGAHNDRRELLKMLDHLAASDVVTVTRIDRLARSTFDLLAISAGSSSPGDPAVAALGDQRRTHRNLGEVVYPGSIASGDLGLLLFSAVHQNLLNDLPAPGEGGLDMGII